MSTAFNLFECHNSCCVPWKVGAMVHMWFAVGALRTYNPELSLFLTETSLICHYKFPENILHRFWRKVSQLLIGLSFQTRYHDLLLWRVPGWYTTKWAKTGSWKGIQAWHCDEQLFYCAKVRAHLVLIWNIGLANCQMVGQIGFEGFSSNFHYLPFTVLTYFTLSLQNHYCFSQLPLSHFMKTFASTIWFSLLGSLHFTYPSNPVSCFQLGHKPQLSCFWPSLVSVVLSQTTF